MGSVGPADIQLRQKPGDGNSLGLVKFIFPNPYNVYLHDTPADNLFAKLTRNFSHGCVRMDNGAITVLAKILPLGTPVQINP